MLQRYEANVKYSYLTHETRVFCTPINLQVMWHDAAYFRYGDVTKYKSGVKPVLIQYLVGASCHMAHHQHHINTFLKELMCNKH